MESSRTLEVHINSSTSEIGRSKKPGRETAARRNCVVSRSAAAAGAGPARAGRTTMRNDWKRRVARFDVRLKATVALVYNWAASISENRQHENA
jgi:hypothetical protein